MKMCSPKWDSVLDAVGGEALPLNLIQRLRQSTQRAWHTPSYSRIHDRAIGEA